LWSTLVLRPQPGIGDPERVVWVLPAWQHREQLYATKGQFAALASLRPATIDLAYYAIRIRPVATEGKAGRRVGVQSVSPGFFRVLQTRLVAGIGLPTDDRGDPHVAVISWRFWETEMQRDPTAIGKQLTVGADTAYVIGGIAPEGFVGPEGPQQADVWVPLSPTTDWDAGRLIGRMSSEGRTADRIRSARAELNVLWPQALSAGTGRVPDELQRSALAVALLRGGLHPEIYRVMRVMVGGVAAIGVLTLLIGTANLASLVLIRAVAREREFAIKRALGGRMIHIAREPLVETLILFAIAGTLGFFLSRPMGALLLTSLHVPFPFAAEVRLNVPTMLTTSGVAFVAAILCAVGPLVRTARIEPGSVLRSDAGASRVSVAGRQLQRTFVVAQLLTAFVLIAASTAIALEAYGRLSHPIGVTDPAGLIVVHLPSQTGEPAEPAVRVQRLSDLAEAVRLAAGSTEIAMAYASPGENTLLRTEMRVAGSAARPARLNVVTPSFFSVAGVGPARGRVFEPSDGAGSERVVVLSAAAASGLFFGSNPLGARVSLGVDRPYSATVVGVVPDVAFDRGERSEFVAYVVADQFDPVLGRTVVLTRTQSAQTVTRRIDSTLRRSAATAAVRPAATLASQVESVSKGHRAVLQLVLASAALATVIAVFGVFGLVAYTVQQRRREIAVRLALGSTATRVTLEHVINSLKLAALGLAPGLLIGWGATVLLAPMIESLVRYVSKAALLSGGGILVATCVATAVAVRLSASFNPAELLRSD